MSRLGYGRVVFLAVLASAIRSAVARAHEGRPLEPHDLWAAWETNPAVVVPLILVPVLYVVGVQRLWKRAAPGRGVRGYETVCFAMGWLALSVGLLSPLHALGGVLFSAHMTQHELIMVVAAPLLVLGRPAVAYVWGMPRTWRRHIHAWTRRRWLRRSWKTARTPAGASAIHAVVIAAWHLPGPYQATLDSDFAHALQHTSFIVASLLFWWAMLGARRATRGQSVLFLFATMLWTGALGALLAFAPSLWYPQYAATTGAWGLTPIEDQQLGGIIMWIPGGASYLIAALALLAGWLRESQPSGRERAEVRLATWRSA